MKKSEDKIKRSNTSSKEKKKGNYCYLNSKKLETAYELNFKHKDITEKKGTEAQRAHLLDL